MMHILKFPQLALFDYIPYYTVIEEKFCIIPLSGVTQKTMLLFEFCSSQTFSLQSSHGVLFFSLPLLPLAFLYFLAFLGLELRLMRLESGNERNLQGSRHEPYIMQQWQNKYTLKLQAGFTQQAFLPCPHYFCECTWNRIKTIISN